MSDNSNTTVRIRGLDSLRFICALLVVFQHTGGMPLLKGLGYENPTGRWIHWFYDISSCGFAAVIVFFVISGFCIHFPYRTGQPVLKWQFWLRRYIRVLPPLLLAMGFGSLVGVDMSLVSIGVTWSVVAELIYYALYPVILRLSKRWGWNRLLAGSLAVSAFVIALHLAFYPQAHLYAVFGPWLNWVVGLPCWLLGCKLAHEWNRQRRGGSFWGIWSWRLGIFAAAWLSNALMVHTPIGLPWTLNAFAFAVFFWLREEIAYYQFRPEPRLLAWAGGWSYSLYLTHEPAHAVLRKYFPASGNSAWLEWALSLAFILAVAWFFYRVFEYPSHCLARRVPIRPFGLEPRFSRSEVLSLEEKYLPAKVWPVSKFTDLLHQLFRLYVQAPEHPGKLRVEHWLAKWILPVEGVPYNVKSGIRMLLHPGDWIEYLLIKTGSYEPVTLDFIGKNLREGDTAFFAGVNFGLHVAVASTCVGPRGRVVGIEPQPRSLCRTMENLRLNGLDENVILVAGALGSRREILPMEEAPLENTGTASLCGTGEQGRLRVCVQPVEDLAANLTCLNPRLFLIDVEGFEEMVLRGFGSSFRPEFLIIEINAGILSFSPGAEEGLLEKLADLGYQLYDLKGRPAVSGMELIEANIVAVFRGKAAPVWAGGN